MGRRLHQLAMSLWVSACQPPAAPPPAEPVRACNGSAALCERPLDQVSFAITHNAMASAEADWWFPNQTWAVPRQLEDGIRGISFDTHYDGTTAMLCHSYCELGSQPLVDGLREISDFLAANPDEVLVMDLESYVSTEDTVAAFEESGLIERVHAHVEGSDWPTLAALIDADERLVVLSDTGGEPDWYHYTWDHAAATHWHFESTDEFRCDIERGEALPHRLYGISHFLTAPVALPTLAEEANASPLFLDRLNRCWTELERRPVLVGVDFYEIGDVLSGIASLNAQEGPR